MIKSALVPWEDASTDEENDVNALPNLTLVEKEETPLTPDQLGEATVASTDYLYVKVSEEFEQTLEFLQAREFDYERLNPAALPTTPIGLAPINEEEGFEDLRGSLPPAPEEKKPPKAPRPKKIRVKGCCDDIKLALTFDEGTDIQSILYCCPICQHPLAPVLEEKNGKWSWKH